jgi:hypothetical protein
VTGIGTNPRAAVLRLTVYDGGPSAGSVYAVSNTYAGSTTQWTEAGLAWSNAPLLPAQHLDSAGPVKVGAVAEYTVTSAVRRDGTYSFALDTSSGDMVAFRSREFTSSPPMLVITP